jgi:FkbM family methyltransferase
MIRVPSYAVYQHLYFKGFFKVSINKDNSFNMYHPGTIEENEIFWKGLYNGWEKRSVKLWTVLSKDAKIIFDIGANTGLYSLIAKTINKSCEVYAFEPLPGVFRIFEDNVKENNYNIHCYLKGLSDYDGKATVYLPEGTDFAYSVTVNKKTISQNNFQEVQIDVNRLDTFIKQHKIEHIDLMKIDVETHEVEVLNGMAEYLYKFKPTLIIEVLDHEIGDKLNKIFERTDYLYFNIDDKNDSIRQENRITKSDYWNYLVCSKEIAQKLELI